MRRWNTPTRPVPRDIAKCRMAGTGGGGDGALLLGQDPGDVAQGGGAARQTQEKEKRMPKEWGEESNQLL